MNEKGVPSGEILSLEAALTQEQAKHRHAIETIQTDDIGVLKLFNPTAKFSKTPGKVETPPPALSQHTEEILIQLGYIKDDVKRMKDKGVI